jgi:uncharacterized protein
VRRDRLDDLKKWRHSPQRKPLLLRGCRQVGKSWLVRDFAQEFEHFIEINFEKNISIHQYFAQDLNIDAILEKLSLTTATPVVPGETLIFFDEIQSCEAALRALRYFKEDRPDIHIIAAGSLLDFALNKHGIAVGRVQFMQLYPLSFGEYLSALDLQSLREFSFQQTHDPVLHQRLIEQVKNYLWLGGMPAVIDAWISMRDLRTCQHLQDEIIESYQIDFHKYAKQHEIPYITQVFNAIPNLLGKKFIYANVSPETRSEYIKNALLLLETAGIAKRCFQTSAQNPPLEAQQSNKKFKVFYFDVGIAQRLLGLDIKQWALHPLLVANKGAIAEQFVAQEFMAYADFHKQAKLHYWHRENKSSRAKIDFVTMKEGCIIPVEVKSAQTSRMQSMQLFLDSHKNTRIGLKISEGPFAHQPHLTEIPFYGLEGWCTEKTSAL